MGKRKCRGGGRLDFRRYWTGIDNERTNYVIMGLIFTYHIKYFIHRCKNWRTIPRLTEIRRDWKVLEGKMLKSVKWSRIIGMLPGICASMLN